LTETPESVEFPIADDGEPRYRMTKEATMKPSKKQEIFLNVRVCGLGLVLLLTTMASAQMPVAVK